MKRETRESLLDALKECRRIRERAALSLKQFPADPVGMMVVEAAYPGAEEIRDRTAALGQAAFRLEEAIRQFRTRNP